MKLLFICSCLIFILETYYAQIVMKNRPRQFYRNISPQNQNDTNNDVNTPTTVPKSVTMRFNQLTLTLEYMLSKCEHNENNILFAPINILKTLSTVLLGTGGLTEAELFNALEKLLGRRLNQVIMEFHQAMGNLLRKVTDEAAGVKFGTGLDIAGGVFVQKDYPVHESYEKLARQIYNTDTYRLDFVADGFNSAHFINEWVSNKTHGRISEVVHPPITGLTKVIIAGVLFFNGDWERPFFQNITKWQPFYLSSEGKQGKENVMVQMMVNQGKVPYYENKKLGYQAIGIPYKNNDVIMYVVLPKLNVSLRDVMCKLSAEEIDNITSKSTPTEIFYVIPKMKLDFQTNLRDTLRKLDVRTLFDPQTANFSKLTPVEGVYASDILHKVDMEINELGTTAAATTVVSVNRGGYVNFRVERPFFFFIYNARANVIMFWASIRKPTPNKPNETPIIYPAESKNTRYILPVT